MDIRKRKIAAWRRSQPRAELQRKADKARRKGKRTPEDFDLDWALAYKDTIYLGYHHF